MQDVQVRVGEGTINVWHRPPSGDSSTVVLVHGLTGTSRWWLPVIDRLPNELGLMAIDVRGRGQSWRSPGPYDLKTVADDIATCLDHFDVSAAIIAGYSMGAWVASLFAQRHRHRGRHLVLVDGGFPIEFDSSLTPAQILDQVVGPAVARLAVEFPTLDSYLQFWREHPALVGRWHPELDVVFAYDVDQEGTSWKVRANKEAILRSGSDFALDNATVESGIKTPVPATVLIVDHGMLDQPGGFTSRHVAMTAASENPNLEVRPLEGLNHYTLILGGGVPFVVQAIADAVG